MPERLTRLLTGRIGKWVVVAVWLAVVVVAVTPAGKLSGIENNDPAAYLPASAESTKVLAEQARFLDPNVQLAVAVLTRDGGVTAADAAHVRSAIPRIRQIPHVTGSVVGPIRSADGQALQLQVPLRVSSTEWTQVIGVVGQLRTALGGGDPGLRTYVTGPAGLSADTATAFQGIEGKLLYAAAGVVIVILLLTYRSPVLWLLPLLSAGAALFTAEAAIYGLARGLHIVVNSQNAGILTVLVFGAGTDYALLLVARYREELRRRADRHDAMAVALHRASPAILASSATVMIGMLCLLVADTKSTQGLGPVAAIGVAIALLAMLTLLPALLVVLGRWVFWPVRPAYGSAEPSHTGAWARIGAWLRPRPRRVWIATTVVLAVASAGILTLDATGLSEQHAFTTKPESVIGQDVLARHFPAGTGNPAIVVASAGPAAAVRAAAATSPGVAAVSAPIVRGGTALLQATLTAGVDSPAAFADVQALRDRVHAVPGADALVGGATAIQLDARQAAARDNLVVLPLVLAVVLAILVLVLRSLLAPVLLIGTVVLSFGAALGVSALAFRYVFGFAGADPATPLYVFVFLVALGIDYNIFLMTRVHEESARHGTRAGALVGLATTGGVITSAGLVLAGTFAVLTTLPMVAFAEIGIAVAFGVLLDTLVVRSVLVTALTLDLGRHMWWPSRLSRRRDDDVAAGVRLAADVDPTAT